jgi:hypothetical protein
MMNFPAIGDIPGNTHGLPSLLSAGSDAISPCPATADDLAGEQDDLIRQLAERARMQRLRHQLQRGRRQPTLASA